MSFWDRHKDILMVVGGFLFLLLITWLFYLHGSSNKQARLDKNFKSSIQKDIDEYTNRSKAARVDNMKATFNNANKQLQEEFDKLCKNLEFKFPAKLIPDGTNIFPPSYVRQRLREERDYCSRQFSTIKNVVLTPEASNLGLSLPDEVNEDIQQDITWMRQILVLRRFIDLLLAIPNDADGEQPILEISLLRPLPAEFTGPPPAFLREFPVEAEMKITLNGLNHLLNMCSQPSTMHFVRSLSINSVPGERSSRAHSKKDMEKRRAENWHVHYYNVRIVTSTAEYLSEKARKELKEKHKKDTKPKKNTGPIPH